MHLEVSLDEIPIDFLIQNICFQTYFDFQKYITLKYSNLFKITIESSIKL